MAANLRSKSYLFPAILVAMITLTIGLIIGIFLPVPDFNDPRNENSVGCGLVTKQLTETTQPAESPKHIDQVLATLTAIAAAYQSSQDKPERQSVVGDAMATQFLEDIDAHGWSYDTARENLQRRIDRMSAEKNFPREALAEQILHHVAWRCKDPKKMAIALHAIGGAEYVEFQAAGVAGDYAHTKFLLDEALKGERFTVHELLSGDGSDPEYTLKNFRIVLQTLEKLPPSEAEIYRARIFSEAPTNR